MDEFLYKSNSQASNSQENHHVDRSTEPYEKTCIKCLASFPHIIKLSVQSSSPNLLAQHLISLANSGRKIYGVGTVVGHYKYDENLYYEHSRPVRWELTYWEPLDVENLGLPDKLAKKILLNRTVLELDHGGWDLVDKALYAVKSPFKGLNNFEGVCRAPQTEQEAIILFGKLSQHLKMRVEYVGKPFPDALIRVKEGNKWTTKAAEFELRSSDFEAHGHLKDMKKGKECDMIICWKDDWEEKPQNLKVIELRKELDEIV